MPSLLIVAATGPEDPTRASIPFHIACNGATPAGTECAVALAGDAAELLKPDVIAPGQDILASVFGVAS